MKREARSPPRPWLKRSATKRGRYRFIQGLALAGIEVDRRILAELAVNEPATFAALVESARSALPADTSAPKTAA